MYQNIIYYYIISIYNAYHIIIILYIQKTVYIYLDDGLSFRFTRMIGLYDLWSRCAADLCHRLYLYMILYNIVIYDDVEAIYRPQCCIASRRVL